MNKKINLILVFLISLIIIGSNNIFAYEGINSQTLFEPSIFDKLVLNYTTLPEISVSGSQPYTIRETTCPSGEPRIGVYYDTCPTALSLDSTVTVKYKNCGTLAGKPIDIKLVYSDMISYGNNPYLDWSAFGSVMKNTNEWEYLDMEHLTVDVYFYYSGENTPLYINLGYLSIFSEDKGEASSSSQSNTVYLYNTTNMAYASEITSINGWRKYNDVYYGTASGSTEAGHLNCVAFEYRNKDHINVELYGVYGKSSAGYHLQYTPLTASVPDYPQKSVSKDYVKKGDTLTYEIEQEISERVDSNFYYASLIFEDVLDEKIQYNNLRVYDSNGNDVTSTAGTTTYNDTTRKLTYTFNSSYLSGTMKYIGETYRFVVNTTVKSSSSTSLISNKSKTIFNNTYTRESETVESNIYSNVVTKYIDENTGNEIAGYPEKTRRYNVGEEYKTQSEAISGYELTRHNGIESGITTTQDVEVTYYYKKKSQITVKYLDKYTNIKVANEELLNGLEGENYTTTQKDVEGYVYDSISGSSNGKYQAEPITIQYYYIKKSNVTTKYVDENTGNEIPNVQSVTEEYKEKESYNTLKKEIDGYTYTKDSNNTSGTVERDNIEVVYYYKRNSNVVVKYLDKYTKEEIANTENIKGLEGENYTTIKKDIDSYEYDSIEGENAGKFSNEEKNITYYYIKKSKVTTKYVDENTGNEIPNVQSVTEEYKEKESYNTLKKEIDGYTYTKDSNNTSGTVERDNIEVVYYYKRNSNVVVKYLDKYTKEEIANTENIKGLEGENYTTIKKDIDSYEYDSIEGENAGKFSNEEKNITYYYIKKSKVTTKYVDENTGNEITNVQSITEEYKEKEYYTTQQKDIDGYTYSRSTNNISGIIGRDNIEVIYYYKRNSGVTIRYIDKYETDIKVHENNYINGVEGDNYTTSALDIEGYVYDSVDGLEDGKIQSEKTTVTYYYIKKSNVYVQYRDEISGAVLEEDSPITYIEKQSYETSSKDINGYTLVGDSKNTSGIIGRENIFVKYYYKKNTSVVVKYIDMVTQEEISKEDIIYGLQNDDYETEKRNIDNYEFIEIDGKANGKMEENQLVVIYKYKKQSNLITQHIDANTNKKIIDDIVTRYKEGDIYTANSQNILGYVLVESPQSVTGTMGREDIIKTFYYKKISAGLVVKYVDKITGEVLEQKEYSGNEKDIISLEEMSFMEYVLDSKPDFDTIELTTEPQEIIYYYIKVAKLYIEGIDQDSKEVLYNSEISGLEGQDYEAIPKDVIGYKLVKIPENQNGIFKRNNPKVIYEYKKIAGNLSVKYIDKDTSELLESYQISGLVGDEYKTQDKEFKDYNFVEIIGDNIGILKAEEKEVVYYYEKKTGKIIVKYIDNMQNEIKSKEEYIGKVGQEYTTDAKNIEGYELYKVPENQNGVYEEGIIEIVYEYKKNKGTIVVNFKDEEGNVLLEKVYQEGEIGEDFYLNLPEIEGYTIIGENTLSSKFVDGKLEYNIIYTRIYDNPNTGDISIMTISAIAIFSIIGILFLILKNNKKYAK